MRKAVYIVLLTLICEFTYAQIPQRSMNNMQAAARGTVVSGGVTPALTYPPFESVVMTVSNAPSPVMVTWDNCWGGSIEQYKGYQCFTRQGDNNYAWYTSDSVSGHWVKYNCGTGNSNVVTRIFLMGAASLSVGDFKLEGSMDDSTYDTIITGTKNYDGIGQVFVSTNTPKFYQYFKFTILSNNGAYAIVNELSLGNADFESPFMTANDSPSPYAVTASREYSAAWAVWKAYDFDKNTTWTSDGGGMPDWSEMSFGSNVVINGFFYTPYPNYGGQNFQFQASSNHSDYITLSTGTVQNTSTGIDGKQTQWFTNGNQTAYQYYRLLFTSGYNAGGEYCKGISFKHYK